MSTEIDPHEVLGVGRDASLEEIEEAYQRLKSRFHPDRFPHGGDERLRERADKAFSRIQAARDMLIGGGVSNEASPDQQAPPEPAAKSSHAIPPPPAGDREASASGRGFRPSWLMIGIGGGVVVGALSILSVVFAIANSGGGSSTSAGDDSAALAATRASEQTSFSDGTSTPTSTRLPGSSGTQPQGGTPSQQTAAPAAGASAAQPAQAGAPVAGSVPGSTAAPTPRPTAAPAPPPTAAPTPPPTPVPPTSFPTSGALPALSGSSKGATDNFCASTNVVAVDFSTAGPAWNTLTLYLYTDSRSMVDYAFGVNGTGTLTLRTNGPGCYYLEISASNNPWTIAVNWSPSSAQPSLGTVTMSSNSKGVTDNFCVSNNTITVEFSTAGPAWNTLTLYLYTDSRSMVDYAFGVNGTGTLTLRTNGPGCYYLEVSASGNQWTITVSQ